MRRLLLLVPVLFLSACNVFEGLGSDALSSDTEVLLSDGRSALGNGNTGEAVRIFERAVESAPSSTFNGRAARLGLASAILQRAGIDVLTLERLVSNLDEVTNGTLASYTPPAGSVCSYGAGETVLGRIDLDQIDGYRVLRTNTAVLTRAQGLITEALGLSATATRAEIQARIQALRAAGGDTSLLAGALADGAIATIGIAYDRIVRAGGNDMTWVVLTSAGASSRYIGYCAPSVAVRTRAENETACAMPQVDRAVTMVEVRAALFPAGSLAAEISTKARDGYKILERELTGTCAG